MFIDVILELQYVPLFLMETAKFILTVSYIISIAVLTAYAVWYVSSFIVFYRIGSLKPKINPKYWPRVGIVIPVYNDYEVLSSLKAILNLNYPKYVAVVVDDSTDPWLVVEISNIAFRSNGKIVHLRRHSRRGLKAGALNDAIKVLEKYGVEYVLFLDADFEPEPDMLKKLISLALSYNADVVQGYQRHFKGSNTVFGILYRASLGGAIINIVGRQYLELFSFFTGSCALIKYSLLRETLFAENSLSEDLRWTIDTMLKKAKLKVIATHEAYANGSVPRSQKAFIRQQIRWSSGTLREFLNTFSKVLLNREISWSHKIGYVHQGLFFTQGLWIYINLLAPVILSLIWGFEIGPLWPLGVYVWLIGFETIVISGSLLEKYGRLESLIVALLIIPMVYYVAAIHIYGTLKTLITRKAEWTVTSKRGVYEAMYSD